jgi:hypothetical protein
MAGASVSLCADVPVEPVPFCRRRKKAIKLLAKAQLTVKLVRAYDTIAREDLPVAHLLTNHHLAKSIRGPSRMPHGTCS